MDITLQTAILSLVAVFLQYAIIRLAVNHGNNASYRDKQLWIQNNLLMHIARKAGVPEEDINKSINEKHV